MIVLLIYLNLLWFFIYQNMLVFSKCVLLFSLCLFSFLSFGPERQNKNIGQGNQYPGVVRIIIPGRVNATGVFVTPDTIVTDFHVVERFRRSIHESGFFFANSEIGFIARQDVTIRSLDGLYDLAALRVEGFQSKFFYPLDSSFDFEKDIKNAKEFTVVGFPSGSFRVEHGSFVDNHSFGDRDFVRISNRNGKSLFGMSGGPVFSKGKLVGIVTKADNYDLVFTSSDKLKQLLSKPDLSCSSVRCIKEEKTMLILKGMSGNRTAQLLIGTEHIRTGDYNEAADWLRKAAAQDLYMAQYYLSKILSEGKVGSDELIKAFSTGKELSPGRENEANRIFKEALYWMEKAATEGRLADAQVLLGITLEEGALNITQSWEKAFYWYKEAAAQGHHGAVKKIEQMSKNKSVPLPLRKMAYRTFIEVSRSQRLSAQAGVKGPAIERGNIRNCLFAF